MLRETIQGRKTLIGGFLSKAEDETSLEKYGYSPLGGRKFAAVPAQSWTTVSGQAGNNRSTGELQQVGNTLLITVKLLEAARGALSSHNVPLIPCTEKA